MVLLHGSLKLRVVSGKDLWSTSRTLAERCCQTIAVSRQPDPYFTAHVGKRRILKSHSVPNTDTPKWNTGGEMDVCDDVDWVTIHVKSQPRLGSQRVIKAKSLGYVWIRAEDVVKKKYFKGEVNLGGRFIKDGDKEQKLKGKIKQRGSVYMEWRYLPKDVIGEVGEYLEHGQEGRDGKRWGWEVPRAYFGAVMGNRVRFYQDAECADGFHVPLKGWERTRCWKDIYEYTMRARRLIYVAGWSVFTEIQLIRDGEDTGKDDCMTVGELLIKKANEGVEVKVFIWDEMVSTNLNKGGLMATHDEATHQYFAGTKVDLLKVSREDDGRAGCCGAIAVAGLFTFHQKLWIVDGEVPNNREGKLELCGFVGGLDITDGRYDDQRHSLFQTLDTVHADDFHQACVQTTPDKGPREPWHDCHSLVNGPGAWQLCQTFAERWKRHTTRELRDPRDEIGKLFLGPDEEAKNNKEMLGNSSWSSQVFRSLDARSCAFEDENSDGLHRKKGRLVDASIQRAYIHLIRKAKRFIYIENQYFMGSSRSWEHPKSLAPNLVPIEICRKIEEKIAAGQDFHAYVVVPMCPEGQIGDRATEELLHWQKRTCEMIWQRIAETLEKHKVRNRKPIDYFSVYCLGNREKENPKDVRGVAPPTGTGRRPFKNRRFMIYVHSKLMIVDDEVAIIGSANINERSMSGSRDVEICASYWQPKYNNSDKAHEGGVALFRKSLWYEHMKKLPKHINKPESLECIKEVRNAAVRNWEMFTQEEKIDLEGHLLRYPYRVDPEDGDIHAVVKHFPDIPVSSVLGYDTILPNILTA